MAIPELFLQTQESDSWQLIYFVHKTIDPWGDYNYNNFLYTNTGKPQTLAPEQYSNPFQHALVYIYNKVRI